MASTRLSETEARLREQLPPEHFAGFDRLRAALIEAEGVAGEVFPHRAEPDVADFVAQSLGRCRGRLLKGFVDALAFTAEERDL